MIKKLKELEVKLTRGREKHSKTSNVRTNVWCSNCGGHGHFLNECASPLDQEPRCTYCGGKHFVTLSVNQMEESSLQLSWNNKNPNQCPFTRPNMEPHYCPNDGRPRWND